MVITLPRPTWKHKGAQSGGGHDLVALGVAARGQAERLRDEVDIDAVVRDLSATVDSSVRPMRLGLWLREGSG